MNKLLMEENDRPFLARVSKFVYENGNTELLYINGETRKDAGPRSEAQSYWAVAESEINAINVTTVAACLILSVDETVKNPKVRRRVHKEMLLLERWVEAWAGVSWRGRECEGIELFGFEDANS
ncbi:hypothetical protein IFM89_036872 [Coptis chinensis]|uniref:Uncharacterized protein n=1 Tax=Coptis chinensis TaxID=261450 RepID=A0A835LTZ9_9MAGN|nr:hypothetical protein IFM89_036872 [Coptis chinensis]